ncbi:MAG: hypothetical protein WDN23_14065 [Edaphobacter sp.]
MPAYLTTRAILGTLLLSAAALAQSTPPQTPPPAPCPATTPDQQQDQTAKPCTPQAPAPHKSAAEEHPFPGDVKPAAPPDSPAPSATPSDATTQHPFPGTAPPKSPDPDPDSSSSSSADDPDAADPDNPPVSTRHRLPKVRHVQSDDERVDEDISVAKFYLNAENYQGAYLRAKDAVKVQPDYSLAHFTLAEVAQKMKKNDEAAAEYQLYLKLDPDGEKAKAAKKALADIK